MVGWIWTATGTHFNGLISTSKGLSFADLGTDPILAAAKVPGAGIWQMIFAIGALEVYWEGKYPSYECAGNFGVPAVTSDPRLCQLDEKNKCKASELIACSRPPVPSTASFPFCWLLIFGVSVEAVDTP